MLFTVLGDQECQVAPGSKSAIHCVGVVDKLHRATQ